MYELYKVICGNGVKVILKKRVVWGSMHAGLYMGWGGGGVLLGSFPAKVPKMSTNMIHHT